MKYLQSANNRVPTAQAKWLLLIIPSSLVAALWDWLCQDTTISQETQPESWTVYTTYSLLQNSSNSVVRASDQNSENPGTKPDWMAQTFLLTCSLQLQIQSATSLLYTSWGMNTHTISGLSEIPTVTQDYRLHSCNYPRGGSMRPHSIH